MPDAITVLTSLASSGALVTGLLYLTKNWITERLKQSIQNEYAKKLEVHKAQLKAANDVALEQIKAANGAYLETRKIGHERILCAIDQLWASISKIDEVTPTIVGFDILLDSEYGLLFDDAKFRGMVDEITTANIMAGLEATKNLELTRPYMGEYLWWMFSGYRAIKGRMTYLIMNDRDTGSRVPWRQDDGIRQHLDSMLEPKQVQEIYELKIAPANRMFQLLKQRILHASTQIISGERSAADGLETAQRIAATVAN